MLFSHEPDLDRLRAGSGYLGTLLKNEEHVHWLIGKRSLWRKVPLPELYRELSQSCAQCGTFKDLALCVRAFKQRHFLRLAGRDLFGWADFPETVAQISDLARACLQYGLHILVSRPNLWMEESASLPEEVSRFGDYIGVLGLGKLGGNELNFVSDIDLIFLRGDPGTGLPGPTDLRHGLCRMTQALTRLLAESVGGDRVFVVDMRLRPGGKDGELVVSVDRALDHYQIHGRSWERQALLKARPVAGQRSIGHSFLDQIRPFVFRRFLDFQALDELKGMRDRMLHEAKDRANQPFDLKMGQGGIREIEFVVQSLQLVYGGRYPELDEPNTLDCLQALKRLGLMPQDAVQSLSSAYVLLRRAEHWVQLDRNRQTHVLPGDGESLDRLAMLLGFASGEAFFEDLQEVREEVHGHFTALFQPSGRTRTNQTEDKDVPGAARSMAHKVVSCPPFLLEVRQTVQRVMDRLEETGKEAERERWAYRLTELMNKAGVRPGLVVLLNECPVWLEELLFCAAVSHFVSSLLLHQPSLMEGLPRKTEGSALRTWEEQAKHIVDRESGYEQRLEWIRRLKNERMLNLALNDVHGRLAPGTLEHELTAVAQWTVQATWDVIVSEYLPGYDLRVAVLALGKMGSREMGYLSDMDLMFVYAPQPGGQDRIPDQVVKLIQRLMRMLSTPLQEGPGYVVDAQIRPSGNYGPLVVTSSRWIDYYSRQADIWEIQALLRMRAVAGDMGLARQLETKAERICMQPRSWSEVWPRLCHLRKRMEKERSLETPSGLDLKLGPGGLADVEFLVQGGQLTLNLTAHNRIRPFRDLLDLVGPRLGLGTWKIKTLQKWHHALRSLELRMQLLTNQASNLITSDEFTQLQQSGLWPPPGVDAPIQDWGDIQVARREIRKVWDEVCAGEICDDTDKIQY